MKENPGEAPRELDAEDLAFNEIFHQEAKKEEQRLAKAGELPSDEDMMKELHGLNASVEGELKGTFARLKKINGALNIFNRYIGSGLAEEMPLTEVIGFLDDKKDELGASADSAVEVVVEGIEDGLTGKSGLFELKAMLEEKRKDLRETIKGEKPEVNLAE